MRNSQHVRYSSYLSQFALLLSLPVLFAGCAKQAQEIDTHPIPIRTVQLGTDSKSVTELFPVTLVRDRESNVSFRVGGVIDTLSIRAGQAVQSVRFLRL